VTDAESGATNRAWRRFIWLNYGSGLVVTMILILHLTLSSGS
jgi:ABC-type multidrug transport system permease subunit